jgi:hypothetical protein
MAVVVVWALPSSTTHLMAASLMGLRVAALFWACQPTGSAAEASGTAESEDLLAMMGKQNAAAIEKSQR